MNSYGLKSDVRKQAILIIFVLSVLFMCFVGNKINYYLLNCNILNDFFAKIPFFIDITYLLTAPIAFKFFYYLFNKYLWKCKIIECFFKVPNLNGRWEGMLISSYHGNECKISMILDIEQTWDSMICYSIFKESRSSSDIICLESVGSGKFVLKFTYKNSSHSIDCTIQEFSGYNELTLDQEKDTLEGIYYTRRFTHGSIKLKRITK